MGSSPAAHVVTIDRGPGVESSAGPIIRVLRVDSSHSPRLPRACATVVTQSVPSAWSCMYLSVWKRRGLVGLGTRRSLVEVG